MKIEISCCGVYCTTKVTVEVEPYLMEGWVTPDQEITELAPHHGPLCAECAPQAEWFSSVCPGCSMGPRDCGLFRLFAYGKYSDGLAVTDREQIALGSCPARSNGTFSMSPGNPEVTEIDLSEVAPGKAGLAVLAGIDAYIKEYPVGGA